MESYDQDSKETSLVEIIDSVQRKLLKLQCKSHLIFLFYFLCAYLANCRGKDIFLSIFYGDARGGAAAFLAVDRLKWKCEMKWSGSGVNDEPTTIGESRVKLFCAFAALAVSVCVCVREKRAHI